MKAAILTILLTQQNKNFVALTGQICYNESVRSNAKLNWPIQALLQVLSIIRSLIVVSLTSVPRSLRASASMRKEKQKGVAFFDYTNTVFIVRTMFVIASVL